MIKIFSAGKLAANRAMLTTKANSPTLMFGAGVGLVATGTILACRATLKVSPVLDDMKEDVEGVKRDLGETEGYQKDLAYAYVKGVAHIGRLYALPIGVTALGISSLTGAHVTLTRRNTALTAAYAASTRALEEYRARVLDTIGEEKERNLAHGAVIQAVENEDGTKTKAALADPSKVSIYAKFFDEYNVNWEKNAELNRLFVTCQQNYCNMVLQSKGHIFLNEVYDMLGLSRTQAGQIVGWVYDGEGDNFVDFGILDIGREDFVNGQERSILLDFNVDGIVYDQLD